MTNFFKNETSEIAVIFVNLGASEAQAQVMAAQLLKRAEQMAATRQISKVEATEILLKKVIEARQGT